MAPEPAKKSSARIAQQPLELGASVFQRVEKTGPKA
jgi:hypothetical protein